MAVLAVGWILLGGSSAFDRPGWADLVLGAVYVGGWALMIVALAGYDLSRLAGTAQIRAHRRGLAEEQDEPLRRDGLHRYVRHPAYTAGFLILWGQVVDPLTLATAVWGSLYLLIGSRFEERWLRTHYGEAYDTYRSKVPAFIPWKGKAI